jgi:hypothetical protein
MIDTKLSIIGNWEKKNETKSGGDDKRREERLDKERGDREREGC